MMIANEPSWKFCPMPSKALPWVDAPSSQQGTILSKNRVYATELEAVVASGSSGLLCAGLRDLKACWQSSAKMKK